MNKGYLIIAQNTDTTNYIKCAEVLCKSIKSHDKKAEVALLTEKKFKSKLFDYVIPFPYGDLDSKGNWKLINDWQAYEASPFDYTIKLEADLYLPKSIDYWFTVLKDRDVVISTTIRNFKQEISTVRYYRKLIDDNKLPDVYNALTYFKKSELAENFFKLVRHIFENWHEFKSILKCNQDEPASTDWVYAIACHIIGVEKTTLPIFTDMSMVHMKTNINGLMGKDWTDSLVYEVLPHTLRINTFAQRYPFHYHVKSFVKHLETIK